MIRVDVLGDCPVFMFGLTHVLSEAGIRIIATRSSFDERSTWLADVVVMDGSTVTVPEDLPLVRSEAETHQVAVLNVADPDCGRQLLGCGVAGVVDRGASAEGVIGAIRSVASGYQWVPADWDATPECAPAALCEQSTPTKQLSRREAEVLAQLSRGRTHGQIANRLGISPHTVDTYVKRIRSKLGVGNKAELTRAALLGHLGA